MKTGSIRAPVDRIVVADCSVSVPSDYFRLSFIQTPITLMCPYVKIYIKIQAS